MMLLIVLSLFFNIIRIRANPIELDDTTCSCSVSDLENIEKLNYINYRRIRIEFRNGVHKYPNPPESGTIVECKSIALYEKILDPTFGRLEYHCRTCNWNSTNSFWSGLEPCGIVKCDRDSLIGNPLLNVEYSRKPSADQQLFEPGQVQAIYKFGNERRCKVCQINGEWSKYSETTLCTELTTARPDAFCRASNLKEIDLEEPGYIRLRVESPDGLFKYPTAQNQVPANSVAVYERYEGSFMGLNLDFPRSTTTYRYMVAPSTATKKYCRYCDDGQWSDIESCVSLKCQKDDLTGEPELEFVGSNMKPPLQQTLFVPFTVIASYTFGTAKFCKQCHENGEWSRYSVSELCNQELYGGTIQTTTARTSTRKVFVAELPYYEEPFMYEREMSCSFRVLKSYEDMTPFFARLFVVSVDRKHKISENTGDNVPSRSFAVYRKVDKVSTKNFCRKCTNGVWSNITQDCSKGALYFCDREKLYGSATFRLPDNKPLADDINLFEPGSVMAIYEISEATKLCKKCEPNGDWSKYAEASLCEVEKAFAEFFQLRIAGAARSKASCITSDLDKDEKVMYTRVSVDTPDGKQRVNGNSAPDGAIAVYQTIDSSKSVLRWCRRCEDGIWESQYSACPQVFSIIKCDTMKLRGVSYFVHAHDAVKLTEKEKHQLVLPGTIVAVYEFGDERYCKMCQEDGEWTRYQQKDICNVVNWPLF